jgi:uracil phosphoribosyltransferase
MRAGLGMTDGLLTLFPYVSPLTSTIILGICTLTRTDMIAMRLCITWAFLEKK